MEPFRIRIEEIQPSQFYVDEDKIEAVKTFITSPKDIIIPVMKENGKYISLDGHTRLAAAIELGYDEVIAFCTEAGDYIFDFVNRKDPMRFALSLSLLPINFNTLDLLHSLQLR